MPQLRSSVTGRILGDRNKTGDTLWLNPGKIPQQALSTPMTRGTVFSPAVARAMAEADHRLVILDPDGLYDQQPRV